MVDGKPREQRIERSESQVLHAPAQSVEWTVSAEISEKARGIYKARLYGAKLQAQGTLAVPARASEHGKVRYKWGTPRLVIGISDPRGIRAAPAATVGGKSYEFAPSSGEGSGGLHVRLPDVPAMRALSLPFSFSLEIGADGFTASWKVSRLAGQAGASNCPWPCVNEQIAVSFIEPAGLYQQLERASKYGFLFIGLTFAAFLLFELLRRLAIHPVQYALVGLALAMFFLLLTALSEHIDFAAAYAIATFACVGLIAGYLVRVLRSARTGLAFGGALAALYAMLFALLKAEDYSLLGGSLLLFGLLAALMIATRRVDWYGLGARAPASA